MKRIAAISIAVGCALALGACNQQVKRERMQQIDSLGTHLNHVREIVESIDSQQIAGRMTEIDNNSMWVFDNITDTLPREPGLAFGDYLRTKKFFNKALDRYTQVKRELIFSEKQLATLRTDVQNSFYADEEFMNYFNTESESIAKLTAAADDLQVKYQNVNTQYTQIKPRVTALLDSIKSVIYASEPAGR